MLHLDLARQLATDRAAALRASAGPRRARRTKTPRTHPNPLRHPIRRLLEWLDRVTPAVGATPC